MDKEVEYVYEWTISHKNNEILPFATTWMDLEGVILIEMSQKEKEKYCMLPLYI